jgi:hypothetical protein
VGSRSKIRQPGVSFGESIYTADGRRLGAVLLIAEDELVIEGGELTRRYFVLDCDEIHRTDRGTLVTSLTLAEAKAREQR